MSIVEYVGQSLTILFQILLLVDYNKPPIICVSRHLKYITRYTIIKIV